MAKKKQKRFNAGALVREIARERIGQPKPTDIIRDKRSRERLRQVRYDIQAAMRGE
jgi:hypothetical protein